MNWRVRLLGERRILDELSLALDSDDRRISRDEEGFYLESSRFEELDSAIAVHDEAVRLVSHLAGAATLISGAYREIQVGGTVRIRDGGLRDITIHAKAGVIEIPAPILGQPVLNGAEGAVVLWPGADLPTLIALIERDVQVAKAVEQLQHGGWQWVNLYRLFDIIEQDVGDIRTFEQELSAQAERFTYSANHYAGAKLDARHRGGPEKESRRVRPMTHREAKQFVSKMLKSWVNSKRHLLNDAP